MGTSRYKFFDKIWNDQTKTNAIGMPNVDLYSIFLTDDDVYYTIPKQYQYRPDLISFNFYGNSKLYWVLIYANKFGNSPEDFKEGVTIRVPSYKRVRELL